MPLFYFFVSSHLKRKEEKGSNLSSEHRSISWSFPEGQHTDMKVIIIVNVLPRSLSKFGSPHMQGSVLILLLVAVALSSAMPTGEQEESAVKGELLLELGP